MIKIFVNIYIQINIFINYERDNYLESWGDGMLSYI